jgi:hypothetical protein
MTAMTSILPGCEVLALDGPHRTSGASPEEAHPNVFVRGLPLAWGESELASVFSQYGELSSIRLVRHSMTKHSLG